MVASLDVKPGLGDRSGRSRLGRHVALSIAAVVVALLLPACGGGGDSSESTSETASGSTLPRNVVLTLSEVKEVLPEMSQETATGEDETALGNPTATRSVANASGVPGTPEDRQASARSLTGGATTWWSGA